MKVSFGEEETQAEQASPELLAFLDADTYNEKYKVLKGMENTITDRLVNDFAVILDVVIPEGELSRRYRRVKTMRCHYGKIREYPPKISRIGSGYCCDIWWRR